MVASEIRAEARSSLSGKWGKVALLIFIYAIISYVISFILAFIPIVGNIAIYIMNIIMSYGLTVSCIKIRRNEDVAYTDFLSIGFSSFTKILGVIGNVILKLIIPACILVVCIIAISYLRYISLLNELSFIYTVILFLLLAAYIFLIVYMYVKALLYSLVFFIRYDNPNMTGKEVVEKSALLMNGNRCSYIWLTLTFIGWLILTVFTFGIGFFWLLPYMSVSEIIFYEKLANINNNNIQDNNIE